MMRPVARVRARRLVREVQALEALRSAMDDPSARRRWQLERLNERWAEARRHVPYWSARERDLPARFQSLEEYVARVPETTRAVVQEGGPQLSDRRRRPDVWRMTGGSTSQPIRLGAWSSEFREVRADTWLGRAWYGVSPDDSLFMLWGHAHLLGTGAAGWLAAQSRQLRDRLVGYLRYSAYDLRPAAMRDAGDALLRHAPRWVVGYAVALDAFAAANADRAGAFARLGLRVAVATAESFPRPESAERVADVLGCPVGMEYGAVETGVLAHTRPGGPFEVFWHRYLIDTVAGERGHRVLVTSLFPRCTPLFRYDMGDEVELGQEPALAPDRLLRVLGRCNDYLEMEDGARVHSELFSHAVRACPEVRAFQVVASPRRIDLHVVAPHPLSEEAGQGIRSRLSRIHPALAEVEVTRVEALRQTAAGKTRMIVRVAAPED